MHKRGFFFTLDAIMALTILAVGMFLVFSAMLVVPTRSQTEIIAADTMAFLQTTTIENLNDPIAGIGGSLWQQGKITKEKNTLLQQMGEFHAIGDHTTNEQFIEAVVGDFIAENHMVQVHINSVSAYPQIPSEELVTSRQSTDLLIAKTDIIFGIMNTTNFEMWGPTTITLSVWHR